MGAELANTASEEGTDEKVLWTTRVTMLKVLVVVAVAMTFLILFWLP